MWIDFSHNPYYMTTRSHMWDVTWEYTGQKFEVVCVWFAMKKQKGMDYQRKKTYDCLLILWFSKEPWSHMLVRLGSESCYRWQQRSGGSALIDCSYYLAFWLVYNSKTQRLWGQAHGPGAWIDTPLLYGDYLFCLYHAFSLFSWRQVILYDARGEHNMPVHDGLKVIETIIVSPCLKHGQRWGKSFIPKVCCHPVLMW